MHYKDVIVTGVKMTAPLIGILFSACAGPISPFGGVDVWSGDGEKIIFKTAEMPAGDFSMSPKRQVLHKESDFVLQFN